MRGNAHAESRRYWPGFLRGEPREIHARMLDSDPLRLRERSAARLRERWILIEPDRAFARAAARVALCAAQEDAPAELEPWALARIDEAFEQILETDCASEHAGDPPDQDQLLFPLLTDCLLVPPERVRAATLAFHGLEELTRRAFFELMVEGRELLEVLEGASWDADELHDRTLAALRAFGYDPPGRTRSLVGVYPKSAKAAAPAEAPS